MRSFVRLVPIALLTLAVPAHPQSEVAIRPATALESASPGALLARPARLHVEDVALTAALQELYHRSGVPMAFSPSRLPESLQVTCRCESLSVGESLERLLRGTELRFVEVGSQVLIEPLPALAPSLLRPGLDAARPTRYAARTVGVTDAAAPEASVPSQEATVAGQVVDAATSRPLAGAQVVVVGTTRGAVTNPEGRYSISGVPAGEARLRATLLGYAPGNQTLPVVAGRTAVADFRLAPSALAIDEVVVVGYGTESRRQLSSAVASVGAEELANLPTASVESALQGRAPGVQVIQNAGNPGNGVTIRVRGPASVNASNQPLYVVDGVPILQDDFSQLGMGGQGVTAVSGINPDEIASIDILKDAAATAIYGSRGSNGVVVITTKRGRSGQSSISFSAYTGWQRTPKRLDMLNAREYVEIFNESAANDGYDPEDYPFVAGEDDVMSTDWQRSVFREAPVNNVQLGVSGGGETVQYYVSGSFFDQTGIVIGSAYNRASGRINLDFTPTSRLAFRSSVGLTREQNDRIEGDGSLDGIVTNAIGMQPMRPVRREDGSFAGRSEGLRYSNPVALADLFSTDLTTHRALGNVEADFRFSDLLRLTGRVGMDMLFVDELQWESPLVDRAYAASVGGVGKSGHTSASKYLLESFATYAPTFGDASALSLVAGASAEFNESELNFIRGEGFTSGFTTYVRNAANVTEFDGNATSNNLVSFFTRADLSLSDRYLFNVALRADGSSRFGEDNRFGVFPAASVGWRITQEPWAAGLANVADVKLRASYGLTGNQGISDFAALGLATGLTYSGTPGIGPSTLANPDLRWETTRAFDAGVDLGLIDNRLLLTVDYYHRNTSDLLVLRPIPLVSGFSSVWSNVGSVRNQGLELGFASENVRPASPGGFSWTTKFNVSANRNEVTELYDGQSFTTGIRETSIVKEGEPLGSFSAYAFDGVDPQTGDAILRDVNGDGEITSADRTVIGDPQPEFYGGLSNGFAYRGFDLQTFFQFSQGNDVLNLMRLFADDGACTWDNKFSYVLDRWQKPGDVTDVPRMSYDCSSGADVISSRYVEDGSYLRVQEVTLGYGLPRRISSLLGMANARVYVSGFNLHTFTGYSGYNPDVNSSGSGSNVVTGTDFYAYPVARTFSIGISGGF